MISSKLYAKCTHSHFRALNLPLVSIALPSTPFALEIMKDIGEIHFRRTLTRGRSISSSAGSRIGHIAVGLLLLLLMLLALRLLLLILHSLWWLKDAAVGRIAVRLHSRLIDGWYSFTSRPGVYPWTSAMMKQSSREEPRLSAADDLVC